MRLFYSGATKVGSQQVEMSKSLGGFISSTVIANGRLNNIFSDISYSSKKSGCKETKAIFIQNKESRSIKNIVLYVLYGINCESKIQIAAVKPISGEIESIRTSKDIPYQATFYDADVVFASSDITLLDNSTFTPDEVITIEGVSFQMSQNPTTEEFFSKFVLAFSQDTSYDATVNEDGVSGKLTYKIKGTFDNAPEIVSTSDIILYTHFSGGIDNSRLLAETLDPNESIGLWLSKTMNFLPESDIFETFEAFKNNNYLPFDTNNEDLEQIDFVLEFDFV